MSKEAPSESAAEEAIRFAVAQFSFVTDMPRELIAMRAKYVGDLASVLIEAMITLDPNGRMDEASWAIACYKSVDTALQVLMAAKSIFGGRAK